MTEKTPIHDRWLSADEIAEYLGVSKDTVYNWISDRGMPGCKVGRFWKFKKEAVDAWVESGGADAAPESSIAGGGSSSDEVGT